MTTELPRPEKPDPALSAEERELGMDRDITRRDFLNAVALGTGAALLGSAAPGWSENLEAAAPTASTPPWHSWTGYGGVGDYAVSNGDTWDVVNAGHGIRDGLYERSIPGVVPTGETYDLVIVGGGFAGVIAAYTFLKDTKRQRPCLILENHPLIGGEAKRNEFLVRGQRLIGPQGSNITSVPTTGSGPDWSADMWRDIGLPTEFEFAQLPPGRRSMEFPRDNYSSANWADISENHGYFFDTPRPHWVRNPWGHNLEGTPWTGGLRRDLLRWRNEPAPPFDGDEATLDRWLDTITYDDYLTKHRKLHPEVARFADPLLDAGIAPGSDTISAYMAADLGYPGFQGLSNKYASLPISERTLANFNARSGAFSFPGGNDGIMRALVKWLNPEMIEGSTSYADVHNGRIQFEAMDRPGAPCRMRAGATVVRVVHDPESQGKGKPATVVFAKDGKLFSVQACTIIWAAASWSGKHAIQHLSGEYRTAMETFPRFPTLVVNVALDNWRPLYKLGYTTCTWRGGFGFTTSLRAPMYVGNYRPPLDPDQPTVLTLYVPLNEGGLPLLDRAKAARGKLYATSYREYEMQIRRQLVKLFGSAGFDPKRDIAGIVLNRWGHAYVVTGPGSFFGRDGKPAPSDALRNPLGNLTFAHSELAGRYGHSWVNAGNEGTRAARQVLAML